MTLPYAREGPKPLTPQEKKAAFENLLVTVIPVELAAIIIVCIIPVFFLGRREEMILPLIGIFVITGAYFVWGLKKLQN
jgi:hypothetical protein